MSRSFYHWTYPRVTGFLSAKGFVCFDDVEGLEESWMNFHENGEPNRIVEIQYVEAFYKPKRVKRMVRQSGISEEEWLSWNEA